MGRYYEEVTRLRGSGGRLGVARCLSSRHVSLCPRLAEKHVSRLSTEEMGSSSIIEVEIID